MAEDSTLDLVDLLDNDLHTGGPPHAIYDRMRSECPVRRIESNGQKFWSLTRDAEVSRVNRDSATFSNYRGGIFLLPDQVAPLDLLRSVLITMDPPEHAKYRRLLSSAFTPRAVKSMEGSVRGFVTEIIDEVIESGLCEFVADIAVPVPLRVLAQLLGIPSEDIPSLHTWTHRLEESIVSEQGSAGVEVFAEMVQYLYPLIQRQAAEAQDSLVQRLRATSVDGESLTEEQLLGFFAVLIFAGNDTTRNTAATGMLAFLEHPEQWQLLLGNPQLMPNAVEEVLRWTSVVKYFVRTATHDTELGGQHIAEGDRILMWLTSASRDPSLNTSPERFDITRSDPQHRAFGAGGPHFCLGNSLARLELRVILEEVARRMPDIQIGRASCRERV